MNQKPIKEFEEKESNEGSGMDELIAMVFFILVLPLALAKYVTPRWTARPYVWRIKEYKSEMMYKLRLRSLSELIALSTSVSMRL